MKFNVLNLNFAIIIGFCFTFLTLIINLFSTFIRNIKTKEAALNTTLIPWWTLFPGIFLMGYIVGNQAETHGPGITKYMAVLAIIVGILAISTVILAIFEMRRDLIVFRKNN